ncbi:hypothetical protein [Natronocalculus amylovorans]|uniref:Uncharacterized protein n=1 Tax=Natronocalculus amylovorans TaxID=2917812 RepID=A0AAE3FTX8_9EURY|nr:hypothetical protein [Natronocalculus amylovorans]MCL9815587.1 hypothetical protein [Natronocalculus amylovorans]
MFVVFSRFEPYETFLLGDSLCGMRLTGRHPLARGGERQANISPCICDHTKVHSPRIEACKTHSDRLAASRSLRSRERGTNRSLFI